MGALGPVFRTYERTRDRLVAVKVFRLDITPEQAQALAAELSHAAEASLFHPSIVEPIAAGVEGTAAYRAEEYVAAESLDVAVRHYAPAALDRVLPFIAQLAGAIDFARAAGIGHGALHPRDIFVTPDEARATGFGVVEALERVGLRAPVRRPYTAPERVAGRAWTTTADVFSLSAIAYELLTGRRPAGTGDGLGALGEDTPYAANIQQVLARAMNEDPSARYSTALSFASALEAAARGEPVKGATGAVNAVATGPPTAPQPPPVPETAVDRSAGAPEPARDSRPAPELATEPAAEPRVLADDSSMGSDRFTHLDDEAVLSGDAMTPPAIAADIRDAEDQLPLHQPERLAADDVVAGRTHEPAAEEELRRDRSADSAAEGGSLRADLRGSAAEGERLRVTPRESAAEKEPLRVTPRESAAEKEPLRVAPREFATEEEPFRVDPRESAAEREPLRGDPRESAADADEAVATEPLPGYLRESAADEASFRDRRYQRLVDPEGYQGQAVEAPRPAILPLALTLILGLLVGFAAGYVVGGRESQTVATHQASTTTPTAQAPAAGAPVGRQWSEQTVKPVPAPSPAQAPSTGQARTTAQPPTIAPPVPADAPRAGATAGPAKPPTGEPLPTTGTLVVRSTPPGAGVTINGRWRGRTPLTIDKLPFARYVVRVVQPGYAPEREEVALSRAGASRTLSVRLRTEREAAPPREPAAAAPLTVSVYVASNPAGARVFIDGKFVGTAPLRVPDVHIGAHVVRMELPDHRTWSTSARIVSGQDNRITGSLERIQ